MESHPEDITLSAFYRDISLGTTDHGLFTIPEKCTTIEKMGQVVEEKILS